VTDSKVVGEAGILAIRNKTVGVNDELQAIHSGGLKRKSVQKISSQPFMGPYLR
jgi:hypothetical protein